VISETGPGGGSGVGRTFADPFAPVRVSHCRCPAAPNPNLLSERASLRSLCCVASLCFLLIDRSGHRIFSPESHLVDHRSLRFVALSCGKDGSWQFARGVQGTPHWALRGVEGSRTRPHAKAQRLPGYWHALVGVTRERDLAPAGQLGPRSTGPPLRIASIQRIPHLVVRVVRPGVCTIPVLLAQASPAAQKRSGNRHAQAPTRTGRGQNKHGILRHTKNLTIG
jgi:hypothetical protein